MPLQQTFWAVRFGMLVDQFGIPWMVNYEQAPDRPFQGHRQAGALNSNLKRQLKTEEMVNAGVLLAAEGLQPRSRDARLKQVEMVPCLGLHWRTQVLYLVAMAAPIRIARPTE
jgi:hypothetical protein